MDLPKGKQLNFMNRYKYSGKNIESQIGFTVMVDEKAGGQLGFDFGDDCIDVCSRHLLLGLTRKEVRERIDEFV